jgi:hypothetical protein
LFCSAAQETLFKKGGVQRTGLGDGLEFEKRQPDQI